MTEKINNVWIHRLPFSSLTTPNTLWRRRERVKVAQADSHGIEIQSCEQYSAGLVQSSACVKGIR